MTAAPVEVDLLRHNSNPQFHAVLVSNGTMRLNECEQVQKAITEHLGINLIVADA
jgi:GMP synthase (glutamine-hydrolysing)